MHITECASDEEILATYKVATQLYELPKETYLAYVREMMQQGYRLVALYENGQCIAISGFRVGRRLYCGKFLHIDNLVTDRRHRKQGVALVLIEWMKEEAARIGCDVMLADTYIENGPAQALFKREGFMTRGYHLKLDL